MQIIIPKPEIFQFPLIKPKMFQNKNYQIIF